MTEFTENPDGSFSARYYDLRGNSVTISGIENVQIYAVNGYFIDSGFVQHAYSDVIIAGRGNEVIFTDSGIDFVNVGSGVNIVVGGDDEDFISADLSAVTTNIVWNDQSACATADALRKESYLTGRPAQSSVPSHRRSLDECRHRSRSAFILHQHRAV